MNPPRVLLLLTVSWVGVLLVWPTRAEAQPLPPACRLDSSLREPLQRVFDAIRQHWSSTDAAAVPFSSLSINTEAAPGGLRLDLVRDAYENRVNEKGCPRGKKAGDIQSVPDVWTVVGMCQPDGPSRLRCSANALRAVLDADTQGRKQNLGLMLVLAHELSHLIHGDPGAFLSPLKSISRELSIEDKWTALSTACESPDPTRSRLQLVREERADDEAVKLVERFVMAEMKREAFVSPAGVRSLLLGSIETSLAGLRQWQAGLLGHRDVPLIDTPLEGDDVDRFTEWVADRRLCDLFTKSQGTALLPRVAADHALASVRLSRLSLSLASLPVSHDETAPFERMGLGNAGDILEKMAPIIAVIDRDEAEAETRSTQALCARAMQMTLPSCKTLPAQYPRAPRSCPEFRAKMDWRALEAQPEKLPISRADEHVLELSGHALTFARPLGNDALVVGGNHSLGFVAANGTASWFEVPCIPRDAVETFDGSLVICERPLGMLRTSRTAPLAWGRAMNPIFNGEPDEMRSSVRWMARVGEHMLALFVSGSGTTQTIDVTSAEWVTATPWRQQGCDILFHGMEIGLADGRWTGTSSWMESIPRTARFDTGFKRATTFTARATPESLTCGIGPKGPLCLAVDGRIFDPEPSRLKVVGRLDIKELVTQGTLSEAALCTSRDSVWVLLVEQVRGEPVAELHQLQADSSARRVVQRRGFDAASLRCSPVEVTATFSNGLAAEIHRYRTTDKPSYRP